MSEDEYQQLVERVRRSVANPMISTDTGVEAVRRVGELAAQEEIEWLWRAASRCTSLAANV